MAWRPTQCGGEEGATIVDVTLAGVLVGAIPGLVVGFTIGVLTKPEQARQHFALGICALVFAAWLLVVVLSATQGLKIDPGVHTVTGLAAGWLFGKDMAKRWRNGGGDGRQE